MRSTHAAAALLLVLATAAGAQQQAGARAVGRVRGVVVDSLSGRPLIGAVVQIVHADDPGAPLIAADADSLGRFHLDSLPPGDYLVGFQDQLLDSLHLQPPIRKVTVQPGGEVRLELSTPSAAVLRRAYCGPSADSASFGVALGALRDARSGDPIAAGQVVAEAPTVVVRDHALHWETLRASATTDADGTFLLCGVPGGRPVDMLAVAGKDSSGVVSVELPASRILVRDMFVGSAAADGTIDGRVLSAAGAPIRGAHVALEGTGRQAVADDSGRFTLRAAPLGTRTLYTRAIGFFPDERPVDVVAASPQPLELRLPTMQSVLDTIHVYGRRVFRDQQAFERRKRMGFGQFFDRAQIGRMGAMRMTDLLRQLRGIYVVPTDRGDMVRVRGTLCLPTLVVDGHSFQLMESVDEIDSWVRPEEVQAMEVYLGTEAPIEYQRPGFQRPGTQYPGLQQSGDSNCATILVWTNPAFNAPPPR